jgi:tetratricopeptide (TPR) repeat protein
MAYNLAEMLALRQQYSAASSYLDQARVWLENTNQPLHLSILYEIYAQVELARDRLAEAADYADRSVAFSAEVFQPEGPTNAARTYAQALRCAGLVAERRGQAEAADARFQQALAVINQVENKDMAHRVLLSYGELLEGRGAYRDAAHFHRTAACQHRFHHPTRVALPWRAREELSIKN